MNTLINTPIDHKNIGLAKLLYGLRQDLDIYCLISVNANSLNQRGVGKSFFGHLQRLVIESVALGICKIYKHEKTYELNSIDAVLRNLCKEALTVLDDAKLKGFIKNYNGPSAVKSQVSALQSTVKGFRRRYKVELECFKTFRDKKVAHSEHVINIDKTDKLPSYDVMERLFFFGDDFYNLISASFVGVGPCGLRDQRPVKIGLKRIFHECGIEDIKTDMQ